MKIDKKKPQASKTEIRIAIVLMIFSVLLFLSWIYYDFIRLKECKEATELLASGTPEFNYCQAWCIMYG